MRAISSDGRRRPSPSRGTARRAAAGALLAAAALAGASARGGDLLLLTNANPGAPLIMTPLESGSQLAISLINTTSGDPPELFLTGWQFRLVIRPDQGAAGELHFGVGSKPENYVLDPVPHLGPASAEVDGVFTALDTQTSLPLTGVEVPQTTAANLILISLLPTFDARGVFGVYALDGMNAMWLDASEPAAKARAFLNVPLGGGDVRIADVILGSPADFNRSLVVDDLDLGRWTAGFGLAVGATSGDGDADGDQDVDGGDLLIWQAELGWAAPGATLIEAPSESFPAPEPATAVLACPLTLGLWRAQGRRSR